MNEIGRSLMLATDGGDLESARYDSDLWVWMEKFDGVRVLVTSDGRIITRGGNDVTHRFPELLVPTGLHVDAELCLLDGNNRPNFEAVNARLQGGSSTGHARLYAFDLMAVGGSDLRDSPFRFRYDALLRQATGDMFVAGIHRDRRALWERVGEQGGEGIIGRNVSGVYRPGRSSCVVKVKRRSTTNVVVVGRTPGQGSRSWSFGALECALVGPDGVERVGQVGSGFDASDIVDVLEALATEKLFVIEVESLGFTSTGKLRHATYQRMRPDVDPLDCTRDQA